MFRMLAVCFALFLASPSFASTIGTLDLQLAAQKTDEGKRIQSQLDSITKSKQMELAKLQKEMQDALASYQQRAPVLSEAARAAEEKKLVGMQQNLQTMALKSEEDVKLKYAELMAGLERKIRSVAAEVAKERKIDLVLENTVVIYGASTVDVTNFVIEKLQSK